jgi:metal-responsive CopG/Arc/MetJ family transcriptional regulator
MKARTSRKTPKPPKAFAHRAGRKVIVELPASLYAETEKAIAQLSINRSHLIRSALQEFLDKLRKKELESELADGYIANASQARQTAEAFSRVDSELL